LRLFITTLSMFSVIAFGYALAGYGGTLFGYPMRIDYIVLGLAAGFGFAAAAMWLWYRHRNDFFTPVDSEEELPGADERG
jgi:hypothetical protein